MTEKLLVNLETAIPLSAIAATIAYKSTMGAKALLHRFEGDQTPIVLTGPSGEVEVNVAQGRRLYLERLDGADWEVGCSGYRF
jgi:hypothetical protein